MLRVHKVQRHRLGQNGHGRRRMFGEHGHGRRRMLGENGHGQLKGGGPISAVKKFIKKNPKISAAIGATAAAGACATFAAPLCASAAAAAGVGTKAVATAVGASVVNTGVSKVIKEVDNPELKRKIAEKAAERLGVGPEAEAMIRQVVDGTVDNLKKKAIEKYKESTSTEQVIDDSIKIGAETVKKVANFPQEMEQELARQFQEFMRQGLFKEARQNIFTRQDIINKFKERASIEGAEPEAPLPVNDPPPRHPNDEVAREADRQRIRDDLSAMI